MKAEDYPADDLVHDSWDDVSDGRRTEQLDVGTVEALDLMGVPRGHRVVRLTRTQWAHVDHVAAALYAARVGGTAPCGVPGPRPPADTVVSPEVTR